MGAGPPQLWDGTSGQSAEQRGKNSPQRSSGNSEVERRGPEPPPPRESGFEEGLRKGVSPPPRLDAEVKLETRPGH